LWKAAKEQTSSTPVRHRFALGLRPGFGESLRDCAEKSEKSEKKPPAVLSVNFFILLLNILAVLVRCAKTTWLAAPGFWAFPTSPQNQNYKENPELSEAQAPLRWLVHNPPASSAAEIVPCPTHMEYLLSRQLRSCLPKGHPARWARACRTGRQWAHRVVHAGGPENRSNRCLSRVPTALHDGVGRAVSGGHECRERHPSTEYVRQK
jgi:hypothetical protein